MTKPVVFMFSGQGSHYYQMGSELFLQDSTFRYWMQTADRIYQGITGLSVIENLYQTEHKKSDLFTRTLLTHPAIFMVEYALTQLFIEQGIIPSCVLGASLGEFTAAVFAGILSFETALRAVIMQAHLLEQHCIPGSMLALFQSYNYYKNNDLIHSHSELAAFNFQNHFVISGKHPSLKEIELFLNRQKIVFQALPVSHAFHSSYIDTAAPYFINFISKSVINSPTLPFISCSTANYLCTIPSEHFWNIIRLPIMFQASIEFLEKQNSYYYLDMGPSGTLATFVKYILPAKSCSKAFTTLSPFGANLKNIKETINSIN